MFPGAFWACIALDLDHTDAAVSETVCYSKRQTYRERERERMRERERESDRERQRDRETETETRNGLDIPLPSEKHVESLAFTSRIWIPSRRAINRDVS